MTANNEIGTIQPIGEIGLLYGIYAKTAKKSGFIPTPCKPPEKFQSMSKNSIAICFPFRRIKSTLRKGRRALRAARCAAARPKHRRSSERERRGGTESVPHIVAFGRGLRNGKNILAENAAHLKNLRDRFESEIGEKIDDFVFNGDREKRLPHISNVSFRRVEGEGLLINLDLQGIAVSTGSACSSGQPRTIAGHPRARQRRRTGARAPSVSASALKTRMRHCLYSGSFTESG
jgi:cysteine desulfurase